MTSIIPLLIIMAWVVAGCGVEAEHASDLHFKSSLQASLKADSAEEINLEKYEEGGRPLVARSSRTSSDVGTLSTWAPVGSMAVARATHTATRLGNGRVLVAGGFNFSGGTSGVSTLASAELYNPATRSWTAAAPMGHARRGHTATLLADGRVLVVGGAGNSGYLAQAEVYNPATNTWISVPPMSSPRFLHAAVLLTDGRVLVMGGWTSGLSTASTEIYDPASNTWSSAQAMSTARAQHGAILLGSGKVLVMGGRGSAYLSSTESYDPTSNTWSSSGSMSTARAMFPAVLLQSGQVLVSGGNRGGETLSSVDIYNPSSNSWTAFAPMGTRRHSHTATLLKNGTVLVAGGHGRPSAENYNPATNAWTPERTMSVARGSHTATFLNNDSILLAGGTRAVAQNASAELFGAAERDLGSLLGTPVAEENTCGATNQVAPVCAFSNAPDQSFLWTVPSSGTFAFTTGDSNFDTMLQIFDASTGAVLGCNDDAYGKLQSAVTLPLSTGQRLRVTVDGWSSHCGDFKLNICETRNQVPDMTGPTTPSSIVTRSGVYDSSYEAWQAFDSNPHSMWISETWIDPAWIAYEWTDGARVITRYAITFSNGALTTRAPRDWTLEGWNGSSWVVVDIQTNQTNWAGFEVREYTVAWPGRFSKYRLNVTHDNDSRSNIVVVSVGRLELFGSTCL